MTQDERWPARYIEVMEFMKKNHRNPSKYNYVKHTRKQMNQGLLKPERVDQYRKQQELAELYKRKNQYQ